MKCFYDSNEGKFINLDKVSEVKFYWENELLVTDLDSAKVTIKVEDILTFEEKEETLDHIKSKFEKFLNGNSNVFDIKQYLSTKDIYNIKEFLKN